MEPNKEKARKNLWRKLRKVFAFVFVLAVMYVVIVSLVLGQLVADVFDGRDSLFGARKAALAFEFDSAKEQLESAHESFASADKRMNWLRPTGFLPFVGSTIRTSGGLLSSASEVTDSLGELLVIGEDLLQLSGLSESYFEDVKEGLEPSVTYEDLPADTKLAILERISASADELELLIARLNIAEDELKLAASDQFLGPLVSVTESLYTDLVQSKEYLTSIAVAARVLPEMGGVRGEKTQLFLFLNNNELRPGGGFIGSYGVLRLEGGDISEFETADVYTLDDAAEASVTIEAPAAIQAYNATTKWFFRDSNWSPDFATSSVVATSRFLEEVNSLSQEQREEIPTALRVDGVIGMTPTFVADLLSILGNITVSGQTFTSDNVADLLEYQVERGYLASGLPPEQRKEILADLVNKVKSELFALPLSGWGEVIDSVEKALIHKHLVFYSSDQVLEDTLTKIGWGGRVLPETVDVQMVVDANLASLKSDPVVDRSIKYEIGRNQSGDFVGRTTITYDHTGAFDWKTSRYRTYARLYTPAGTKLIRGEGMLLNDLVQNPSGAVGVVDVSEELGLSVFGAFTSVEPGHTKELVFEYELAKTVVKAIKKGGYDLTVYKQIGALDRTLTLDLDFDKNVTHATPAESSGEWGDDTYLVNTILDQDLLFGVEL
ncbi:DUF4012 domain-containing protein [Candidatus Uhrbacteria bacterium]|nr:DUF4012 domain-containing protein [Candidatus Uhrbacteria bacterium]